MKLNVTHTGKIGRLPKHLRNELGQRLEDGQSGPKIIHWLNELPEVKAVLQEQFKGIPISLQNLSQWRLAGHKLWLHRQDVHQVVQDLSEQAGDLAESAKGQKPAKGFGLVLEAEVMAFGMLRFRQETDPDQRWEILCDLRREMSFLRRDDDRVERTTIQREKWDNEMARQVAQIKAAYKAREREEILCRFSLPKNAHGRPERSSLFRHYIRYDLPLEELLAQWEIDSKEIEAEEAKQRAEAEAKVKAEADAKAQREADRQAKAAEEARLDAEYVAQREAQQRQWDEARKRERAAWAEERAEKAANAGTSNQIKPNQGSDDPTVAGTPEPVAETQPVTEPVTQPGAEPAAEPAAEPKPKPERGWWLPPARSYYKSFEEMARVEGEEMAEQYFDRPTPKHPTA